MGGGAQNSCIQSCPKSESKDSKTKMPIKVKVTVFFDGTLNNKTNTESRIAENNYYKENKNEGSFNNDKTNVALLHEYLLSDKKSSPNFDKHFNIYIEGIGTTDNEDDNIKRGGGMFGMGVTGIPAKVENAINEIISLVKSVKNNDKIISLLEIDSLGFSRGAAAARNFIYEAKVGKKNLITQLKSYTEVQELKFNFVGLFDTVSHYGYYMDDDVEELNLNAITNATTVVQLAAADEYRHNFPLINVKSKGIQIDLPGVHSDIGGGYRESVDELKIKILKVTESDFKKVRKRFDEEIKWILDQGWFRKEEITDKGTSVELNRKGIKNTYAIIPRLIMSNHGKATGLKFSTGSIVSDEMKIQKDINLSKLYSILTPLGSGSWRSHKELLRSVRHDYFHFSAYYGATLGAHDPEWTGGNAMTGVRKRVVYEG